MDSESRINQEISISPSDIGQAYVRVLVVGALGIWILLNEKPESIGSLVQINVVLCCAGYFIFSVLFLFVSLRLNNANAQHQRWIHLKRTISLFADLVSCGIFLVMAGSYGPSIYPVYIIIVVGYGLRYGIWYLLVAMAVALISFSVSASHNPVFNQFKSLMIGFYLGLILIPGYAAVLLKKYQNLLRKLSETNAARARFIANMSHELRTPLHAIIGNAEVLSAKLSDLEQRDPALTQLSKSSKMVLEASEHLRTLVDGVLDIASNDAGTFVLGEARQVDFYRLVRSAAGIAQPGIRKSAVTMRWYIDPDVPRFVETWEQHVKAVLINTIGNAVKYTDSGEVTLTVSSAPREPEASTALVRITVSDTGIGIPDSQMEAIFEPFIVGDDGRDRRFEGTGLGLTITKQYLDEMRGRINIESSEGCGTRVAIEIPMKIAEDGKGHLPQTACAVIVHPLRDRDRISQWIESGGFQCFPAAWDGARLVSTSEISQPDVVFVSEHYLRDIRAVTKYTSALFGDAIPVFLGGPDDENAQDRFVTRVQPGNDTQLQNIYSLIGPGHLQRAAHELDSCRVLVVDDNETNLQSAEIALQSYGHQVHTATNGKRALAILKTESFDLVLMDMHMPDRSGVDVASDYAAQSNDTAPVVILTADATKSATTDANTPTIAGFLTKPIKPSELQHAVERYANKHTERASRTLLPGGQAVPESETGSFSRENYIELLESGTPPDDLERLLDRFLEDARAIVNDIKSAAADSDDSMVRQLIHKLKGSAGAMHLDVLISVIESFDGIDSDSYCSTVLIELSRLNALLSDSAHEIRDFVQSYGGQTGAGLCHKTLMEEPAPDRSGVLKLQPGTPCD